MILKSKNGGNQYLLGRDKMAKGDLFDLEGKVAIVTGAGYGLGRAFSEALAEYGADIVVADIDLDSAKETVEIIKKDYGRDAIAVKVDVSKSNEVREMVEKTIDRFRKIDILVNNAGIAGTPLPAHELPEDDWNSIVSVNLTGVFLCAKEVLKVMINQRSGKVINIASIWGVVGSSSIIPLPGYTATKGAVVNLTRELALEYYKYGINVNCIAPGFYAGTKLGGGMGAHPEFVEKATKLIPHGNMGEPDDLKGTVIYLSSKASDSVNGLILIADHGVTCW
jgi:NAD(P)-dependent dehydrogenase (short-subunit alcohol dehydrogenase family)